MGLIDKNLSFTEEKNVLIKESSTYAPGMTPYFYEEEDYKEFIKVLDYNLPKNKNKANVSVDRLPFTYHKPITYAPVIKSLDKVNLGINGANYYGFMRLGLTDTFLRPNTLNVLSCHKVGRDCRAENGNLGYIANPYWATYILYGTGTKKARISDEELPLGLETFSRNYPNPLAAVNVMLGVGERTNEPIALFSKMQGDLSTALVTGAFTNLVHYFISQGYSIAFTAKFFDEKKVGKELRIHGLNVTMDINGGQIITEYVLSGRFLPTITSDIFPKPTNKNAPLRIMPYRYNDVEPSCYLENSLDAIERIKTIGKLHCFSMYKKLDAKAKVPYKTYLSNCDPTISAPIGNLVNLVMNTIIENNLGYNLLRGLEAQKSSTNHRFWAVCCSCGSRIEHGNTSCIEHDRRLYCQNCFDVLVNGKPKLPLSTKNIKKRVFHTERSVVKTNDIGLDYTNMEKALIQLNEKKVSINKAKATKDYPFTVDNLINNNKIAGLRKLILLDTDISGYMSRPYASARILYVYHNGLERTLQVYIAESNYYRIAIIDMDKDLFIDLNAYDSVGNNGYYKLKVTIQGVVRVNSNFACERFGKQTDYMLILNEIERMLIPNEGRDLGPGEAVRGPRIG